jgi:RNA polymerase sigma-70 factor, ECF subfamily
MTLRVIPDRHGPAPWVRRGKVMEVRVQNATDDELARNARLGCVASFEELARRLQAPLVRFISRRFPSRRDAEDLTQETLLRAYQSLGSYRDGRSFRTWIFTIAYRLTISHGRAENSTSSLGEEIDDVRCDPSDILERDEQRDRIWSIARTVLTSEQVSALWLYYVEELPAGDVARVLGRSWVSVKTMLHRARKKLEPHLAAEWDEDAAIIRTGESR